MAVKVEVAQSVRLFVTPWTIRSTGFSRPEYWSGSLLQGVFPTQGWNPGLPHCRRILYQLSHRGSPSLALQVANGGDTPHLSSERTCLHSRVAPLSGKGVGRFSRST